MAEARAQAAPLGAIPSNFISDILTRTAPLILKYTNDSVLLDFSESVNPKVSFKYIKCLQQGFPYHAKFVKIDWFCSETGGFHGHIQGYQGLILILSSQQHIA